jgi:hypothetical protein
MQKNETAIFYPASLAAWREWLMDNHQSQQSVWLVFYRKNPNRPSVTWSEAVDVRFGQLCTLADRDRPLSQKHVRGMRSQSSS